MVFWLSFHSMGSFTFLQYPILSLSFHLFLQLLVWTSSSILLVKQRNRFELGSTGSDANNGGNDIDVTFSTVTRYLNDQHFTHGSADVSLGAASVYFDNCRIEGPSAQFDVERFSGKSESLYDQWLAGTC